MFMVAWAPVCLSVQMKIMKKISRSSPLFETETLVVCSFLIQAAWDISSAFPSSISHLYVGEKGWQMSVTGTDAI